MLAAILLGVALSAEPLTAQNYLAKMSPGINLGNTLEAIPAQTSWGNPKPTQAHMDGVRKAGFRSIRIPAAWSQYADADHRIQKEWMENVAKVVAMAQKAGLYVLLNVHWDGGWMQPTLAHQEKVHAKLAAFWKQIGERFKDADHTLLFAGTNEVGVEGEYTEPKPENAKIQTTFNQVFVDTVRKTGGKNADRWLVVQAYNTNIGLAAKFNSTMPKDTVPSRLMMEVHYYDPYNFTLNDKSAIWQWGKNAKDPKAFETWANEEHVDKEFSLMKRTFVDRGVPVLLGEYCAAPKKNYPGSKKYTLDWTRYVTRSAVRHGLVPMLWDIGLEGGILNRTTGRVQDRDLLRALMDSAR